MKNILELNLFRKTHYFDTFNEMENTTRCLWDEVPFRDVTLTGDFDFIPRLDVAETDTTIEVKAKLPGLETNDVDVTLENDLLVIRGEKKHEEKKKWHHFQRVERHFGSFH